MESMLDRNRRSVPDEVDFNASMRNRLALETCDKDGAKAELRQLKKVVDSHRRSMSFLSDERGSDQLWDRLEDQFQKLERDLHSDQQPDGAPRSYEVLRTALTEAQKRVESLNSDMKHQQNANSEIVRSLGTVKDTNKRLLEQIQQQTGEIAQLTSQRVNDEYKLDEMQKQHRQEEHLWQNDLERRLTQRRQNMQDRYDNDNGKYMDQFQYVKTRASAIILELHNLRTMQQEVKTEHLNNMSTMMKRLETVEKDVTSQLDKALHRHRQSRSYLQTNVQDLDAKLASEKSLRVHEVAQWKQKHSCLLADKEDISDGLTREINQRTSQVHAMERTVQSEEARNTDRRTKLENTLKQQEEEMGMLHLGLDNANRELHRIQSLVHSLESEEKMKEQQLAELRGQMRGIQDSLQNQLNSNDHLRQQFEEQRDRYQAANDKELQKARLAAEEKLKALKDLHDQEEQLGRQQLAALHEMVDGVESDVETKKQRCEAAAAENVTLERDLQMWKNMFDQANKQRQDQEHDLSHLRQEWTRQRLSIQEVTDITNTKRQSAESELEAMSNNFVEFRRQSAARETEITSRIHALEEQLKNTKLQLEDSKSQLGEATDQLSKVKNDGFVENQKQKETIHKLEREVDQLNLDWHEEKKNLETGLESEQRTANEHRERIEKWKEVHQQSLRQLQEESTIRLQNCEREKNRLSEKSRQELDYGRKDLETNQRKVDQLKEQITRSRTSYQEARNSLEFSKRETQRNERSFADAKQSYAEEYRTLQSSTDAARKSEASLTRQFEQSKLKYDQERKRMLKDYEDVKTNGSWQLADADKKLQHSKSDYEAQLSQERKRLTTDMSMERSKVESIVRENDQLKKILGERTTRSTLFDNTQLRTVVSPIRGSTLPSRQGELARSKSLSTGITARQTRNFK